MLEQALLPPSTGLELAEVAIGETTIILKARSAQEAVPCPTCQQPSQRVHSHYWRTTADLPCAGHRVQLELLVPGIDIIAYGTDIPVHSMTPGKVVAKGWTKGFGNYLTIDYNGYMATYMHLAEPSPLEVGAEVKTGDTIGTLGDSGTGGAHLHIEIRTASGVYIDPNDPSNNCLLGGYGWPLSAEDLVTWYYYPIDIIPQLADYGAGPAPYSTPPEVEDLLQP